MLPGKIREILFSGAAVDGELAGAGAQENTGDGFFAATGAMEPNLATLAEIVAAREGRFSSAQRSSLKATAPSRRGEPKTTRRADGEIPYDSVTDAYWFSEGLHLTYRGTTSAETLENWAVGGRPAVYCRFSGEPFQFGTLFRPVPSQSIRLITLELLTFSTRTGTILPVLWRANSVKPPGRSPTRQRLCSKIKRPEAEASVRCGATIQQRRDTHAISWHGGHAACSWAACQRWLRAQSIPAWSHAHAWRGLL